MRSSDWSLVKPRVVVINVSGIRQVKIPPVSRICDIYEGSSGVWMIVSHQPLLNVSRVLLGPLPTSRGEAFVKYISLVFLFRL